MIRDYIFSITDNYEASVQLHRIIVCFKLPMRTFATAVKIFRKLKTGNKIKTNLLNENIPGSIGGAGSMMRYKDVISLNILMNKTYLVMTACCLLAYKYNKDVPYTNEVWAKKANVEISRLNNAERLILLAIDHHIGLVGEETILDEIKPFLGDEMLLCDWRSLEKTKERGARRAIKKLFCF